MSPSPPRLKPTQTEQQWIHQCFANVFLIHAAYHDGHFNLRKSS